MTLLLLIGVGEAVAVVVAAALVVQAARAGNAGGAAAVLAGTFAVLAHNVTVWKRYKRARDAL